MPIDLAKIFAPFLNQWPLFAGLLFIVILGKIFKSPRVKGWLGEKAVWAALNKLDPSIYQTFHDLYLPRPDGKGTTQLDHVVLSPFGIFVVETKNYRGWIFGSPKQSQWTHQIYRRKDRFQNPLHQNDLHVRALSAFLDIPLASFHSVVIFTGDSKFKTDMPDNVLNGKLLPYIRSFNSQLISPSEWTVSKDILSTLDKSTDRKSAAKAHLASLRMLGRK